MADEAVVEQPDAVSGPDPADSGDPPVGDKTMAAADLLDDQTAMLLGEGAGSHQSLMHDTRGNEQSAMNVLRHTVVKQFDEVGPVEAAASEVIMRIKPKT